MRIRGCAGKARTNLSHPGWVRNEPAEESGFWRVGLAKKRGRPLGGGTEIDEIICQTTALGALKLEGFSNCWAVPGKLLRGEKGERERPAPKFVERDRSLPCIEREKKSRRRCIAEGRRILYRKGGGARWT